MVSGLLVEGLCLVCFNDGGTCEDDFFEWSKLSLVEGLDMKDLLFVKILHLPFFAPDNEE